jgi:hypothetical protein
MKSIFRLIPLALLGLGLVTVPMACNQEYEEFDLVFTVDQYFPPTYPFSYDTLRIPFETTLEAMQNNLDQLNMNWEDIDRVFIEQAYVLFKTPDTAATFFRELHLELVGRQRPFLDTILVFDTVRAAARLSVPGGSGYTGLPSFYAEGVRDSVALQRNLINFNRYFTEDSVTIIMVSGGGSPPGTMNDTCHLQWNMKFNFLVKKK